MFLNRFKNKLYLVFFFLHMYGYDMILNLLTLSQDTGLHYLNVATLYRDRLSNAVSFFNYIQIKNLNFKDGIDKDRI